MHEHLSERAKSQFYVFSILIAAMVVRVLVGIGKPVMNFEQSALVGLTTVTFLAPTLYRFFYGEELLTNTRKKVCHALSMVLAGGLFVYYIALGNV
ncbi:MAG: hypothetical protein ACK46X_02265 [Candidatus Sericytochromatia bacterium]